MTQKIIYAFIHSIILSNLLSLRSLRPDKMIANAQVDFCCYSEEVGVKGLGDAHNGNMLAR